MRRVPLSAYMKETSFAELTLNKENKKRISADTILILGLLIAGLLLFLLIKLTKSDGTCVAVSVGGNVVATYSLSEDGEYSINGGTNILVISDGCAFLKEATCPDKLCVRQRKISLSGERIVCLPNRVMVEVLGDGDEILSN